MYETYIDYKNLIVQMLNISQVLKISKKFKKGNSIDAQKLLNSLSKKNKNNYIALFQTANCLNLLGDRIQAKKYFIKESVDYDKRIKIYKLSENFQKVMIEWIKELKNVTNEIE